MSTNIAITICARGGSKGIPGKNIKILDGRPLIAHTINHAKNFLDKYDADILLSTDSREISNVAKECGLDDQYLRPEELANDTISKLDAIIDRVNYEERARNKSYDYIIDLDVTSPLRTVDDVLMCFEKLKASEKAENLFSVRPAHRNPYFNMVEEKSNGFFHLIVKPELEVLNRQSCPKVYDMDASIYVYRRSFLQGLHQPTITEHSLVYEMPHLSFDLDEELDFEFMDFLFKNNKIDFL